MTAKTSDAPAGQEFVISRVFDAPRDLVFAAFTDPERMKHWWGPKGFTVVKSEMDLRPGGVYHYCLRAPDGAAMWGKFVYREIVAPERVVLINSFSDEQGGTTHHPMNDLALGDAVGLYFRGHGKRQNEIHRQMVAAQF